jgi:hypothetical protein
MDINIYTLEVAVKSRLAELRAAAAREKLLASARERRPGVLTALRAALPWIGRARGRRGIASPRHA